VNEIETRVLELIGENTSSPDVYTDDATGMAPIRDSINDAVQEICMVTGCASRTFLIPLEANMTFYRVTPDRDYLGWVTDCWLLGQKRRLYQKDIYYMSAQHPLWLQNTGNPMHYGQIGKSYIWVHPTPTASADVLEINAVAIPSRYAYDDERIRLRDQFQWAATHYAVSEWWAAHGDARQAADYWARYIKTLGVQRLYPATYERAWASATEKTAAEK